MCRAKINLICALIIKKLCLKMKIFVLIEKINRYTDVVEEKLDDIFDFPQHFELPDEYNKIFKY